jgi:hypothetical protein
MTDLPLTPDKARHHYCMNCQTLFEYDAKACGSPDPSYGLDEDFKLVVCPECSQQYALPSKAVFDNEFGALRFAVDVLSSKVKESRNEIHELEYQLEKPTRVKTMLFDQCKVMKEVIEWIDIEEYDQAKTELNQQIEFINKEYGSNISDDISIDHIEPINNDGTDL